MACGISKGIGLNCENLPTSGTKDQLVLMALSVFQAATIVRDVTNPKIIKSIALASGAKAYEFLGQNNSNVARNSSQRGTFKVNYTQEVDFITFDVTPDAVKALEDLDKDRVVAIYQDNNGFVRVAGGNAGLRTSNNAGDTSNADTGGGHQITLSSAEERGFADFFQVFTGSGTPVYSLSATQAAVNALLVAAS